jgi:hypothetical protein
MAPEVGFEPTTNRLTADRSTTELLRNVVGDETNPETGRFKRKKPRQNGAIQEWPGVQELLESRREMSRPDSDP